MMLTWSAVLFFSLTTNGQNSLETDHRIRLATNINAEVTSEPLDFRVNTAYKEFGPLVTKDGTRMYFSRQGYPDNMGGTNDEDIWFSNFDPETQTWKQAENAGSPLNNTGPNFITGIGSMGDTLLLANVYRKNGKMTSGASISIRTGNLWSFPVPVNIEADYNFGSRVGYDLSHDRNTLIIAQQKIDSRGKLDLYVAFRDPDAKQKYSGTESINLGDVINTFGDETSPWLAYDEKTLYFASDGHNGFGKMDIFVTKRLDDTWTSWSVPLNLGPGINSHYDDISFNYNPNDRYAYFARGFSVENTDIFRVEMTELFIEDVESLQAQVDQTPAVIGQTKLIYNVFADNQTFISKEGLEGLRSIVDYFKKYKTMVVGITTHSNIQADRTQSFTLSNERAETIFDYLVSNGIEKKRLSFQGMGHDIVSYTKVKAGTQPDKIRDVASTVEFRILNYEK